MTAHEFMMRVRYAEAKKARTLEEIRRCREIATGISPARGSGGGRGGDSTGKVEKYAVRIADLEAEAAMEEAEIRTARREIREIISQLNSETARELLTGYYLRGKGWKAAAREAGITKQWAMTVRSRAMDSISKILG